MINDLRFHFKVLFKSTSYFYVCIFMIVFALLAMVLSIENSSHINLIEFLPSVYNSFWMIPTYGSFIELFLLLLPIIVSIPCVQFLLVENKIMHFLVSRTSRKSYTISKIMVFFFSGFSLIFIMMMCHWLFVELVFHSPQDVFCGMCGGININNRKVIEMAFIKPDNFFVNPVMGSFYFVMLTSIYGGILSLLVLAINVLVNRAIISVIITFIIVFVNSYVIPSFDYVIGNFYNITQVLSLIPIVKKYLYFFGEARTFPSLVVFTFWIIAFCIFLIGVFIYSSRRDVY